MPYFSESYWGQSNPTTGCAVEAHEFSETVRQLAPTEIPRPAAGSDAAERHPVRIVLENIRSAFNVGSILRTADALRADHVHLTGYTPPGSHRTVHKSALGAQDVVPWSHADDVRETLSRLRSDGFTIVAVEITDRPGRISDLRKHDFPVALVFGNEVAGISAEALACCDMAIELPQYGQKHSLNVAVAAGIVGYDVLRHWQTLEQHG